VSRIKPESVEAVKNAVDMIDLVSGRTQLRKAGTEWRGRCPFHDERTPSFWVNPLEKVFYCFGCQAKGDAISFVKDTEALDYPAAVEWLAERYGVRLEFEESSPDADRRRLERERLLRLLDDAATFYERYLWHAEEAAPARAYLAERGITEETARLFRLGYASAAPDRVVRAAQSKGFARPELERAGLIQGRADRFRERMIFPLADARGKVRGFGARQMPGGRPPKYLNTAEGPVFKKSEILYGLDRARGPIARQAAAIVVEGYTDVILLHQAGIENVVASMGTALTERQVTELRRLCSTVFLAFDADAAGQDASLRGMELALRAGLTVRVVNLPGGRDPADVALEDVEAFRTALDRADPYLTYRVHRALGEGGSRDDRYMRVRALLAGAPASVERDDLVRIVADRLELSDDLAGGLTARNGQPLERANRRRGRLTPRERDERLFLGLCLEQPDIGKDLIDKLDVAHFSDASQWQAATFIRRRIAGGDIAPEEADTWAPVIAELTALAAREVGSRAVMEELFWKLQLRRTQDELKALQENADLSLSQQQHLQELQARRLSILERIRSQASQE
jgi:DNA primase